MAEKDNKTLQGTSKAQTQSLTAQQPSTIQPVTEQGTTNVQTQGVVQQPSGTVPGTMQMLEARAQKQVAEEIAKRKAADVQKAWEPTRDHIKTSGLNYPQYLRAAQEQGAKIDALETLLQFKGQDPSISIEEAEKAKKKAENQEKMNLIGNALMHAGNFIGSMTSGHGAVQLEDPVKFTERQKLMKERTQAINDKAWADTYNMYKQKAAEERAARSEELQVRRQEANERNMAELARLKAEEAARKAAKDAADNALKEREAARKEAADKVKAEQGQQRTDAYVYGQHNKGKGGRSGGSSGRGGSGSKDYETTTETKYNVYGQKVSSKTTKHFAPQKPKKTGKKSIFH